MVRFGPVLPQTGLLGCMSVILLCVPGTRVWGDSSLFLLWALADPRFLSATGLVVRSGCLATYLEVVKSENKDGALFYGGWGCMVLWP